MTPKQKAEFLADAEHLVDGSTYSQSSPFCLICQLAIASDPGISREFPELGQMIDALNERYKISARQVKRIFYGVVGCDEDIYRSSARFSAELFLLGETKRGAIEIARRVLVGK